MKHLIVILIMFTFLLNAQDSTKPKFEKQGKLTKVVFYHDTGAIAQTGFFKDNKLHGNWISYQPSGKKMAMGTYQSGLKTGQWFFWNQGDLIEVLYEENKIVNVLEWNSNEKKLIAKND